VLSTSRRVKLGQTQRPIQVALRGVPERFTFGEIDGLPHQTPALRGRVATGFKYV
jgi:hypothetical protein